MQSKILEVVSIDLSILKKQPPALFIWAQGNVSTTGWSNGVLIPYIYVKPPADGIYEFDFVATPPPGIALEVIMPIVAQGTWEQFPQDLKGIKIYASSNSLVKLLSDSKEGVAAEGGGSGSPRGLFRSL